MTDALFVFHWSNFEQIHIDRSLAREAEATLDPSEIGVVGQQPRSPSGDTLCFSARVSVADFVFNAAARAIRSSVLRWRTIAPSKSRSNAAAARSRAFAPVVPVGPLAIDGRSALHRARRVASAVDLVAIESNAEPSAESRLGISARPASGFHRQAARLRAGGPRRPLCPAAVTRAVRHLVTVPQTALSAVSRSRPVALPLTAHAPIALGAFAGVSALGPLAPLSPSAVNCRKTTNLFNCVQSSSIALDAFN